MKKILFLLCALLSIGASAQVSGNGPKKASYNGHEYVDLGLPSGTLWATCNIGATNPENYGDYFAWGETSGYKSGKTNFAWSTYKYCNGSEKTLTKYNNSSSYGTVDNKTELELADDAAYVNWGGNWRMPSLDQIEELINSSYTTTTWTTQNGVYGRKITSKSNGNSIFLPAAGFRDDTSLGDAGYIGFYWSRTLYTSSPSYAYFLGFHSSNIFASSYGRYYGPSVRPVLASILLVETITLTPASLALAMGATSQLTATVTPSGADNPALTWSSSDPSVAQVSSTGKVVAVVAGTAVITCAATDGSGVKATCQVTVNPPVPTDPSSLTSGEYVDLGLPSGTLWATHNIGATNPEDYGDYFAWGETTGYKDGKTDFSWSTYKYCNGDYDKLTKYCGDSNLGDNGFTDNLTELEFSDDAAYVNWGSEWRIPSVEQFQELINSNYTTTTWTTVNGVYGRKITSKSNGNSIFLPAAGRRLGTSLSNAGSHGFYWSRTLYASYHPYYARSLSVYSSNILTGYDSRCSGLPVRPVHAPLPVPNVATLTDGETYTLASDADYDRVDYVRTFTTTGWQALYVPFALSYADWAGDFEVARLNDVHQWDDDRDGEIDRTALEVILLTGGETVPHTPYLIRAKTAGEKTLTP
ncbi:MAG: Ig-like domain-containing protein, partial [Bacteroidaceae bacterium]|nr:Ig-like domain-containing protein [Bacteroidaceae bacterium]